MKPINITKTIIQYKSGFWLRYIKLFYDFNCEKAIKENVVDTIIDLYHREFGFDIFANIVAPVNWSNIK